MSLNSDLIDVFENWAKILQLKGANRFRYLAYERGARAIKNLSDDLASLAEEKKNLTAIDGIGDGLAEKIIEYVQTGSIEEYDELVASVPPGVIAVMQVPGVGPKTAATFWKEAEITSLAELKQKIDDGSLTDLPRIGKKTLENIRKSIDFAESSGSRARIDQALPLAEKLIDLLHDAEGVTDIAYAGSLRRGRETIGDVDLIVGCASPEQHGKAIAKRFTEAADVQEILVKGETKSSVRLVSGIQADLRIIATDQYGAALLYFTGSKEHNIRLRERAQKRDLRLNEYGLWREGEQNQDDKSPLASKTEESIYQALDLPWIAPEIREDRGEIKAAKADQLPTLITLDDIRCELHAHTVASDGRLSIDELADEAVKRGFHTIAVTDHSKGQAQANGLDEKRLRKHIEAVRNANAARDDITILAGSEVDILGDGQLDYPDELLAELDLVVASPHHALSQDEAKATARLIAAIENPYVHIIGHPTGRLVNRREGLSPLMKDLFKAAAETKTVLEINAHPLRLDLRDIHARAAIEAGCKLAINTDAHTRGDFDHLRFGILTARRAWASQNDVINCLTKKQLDSWRSAKRSLLT